jgi:Plasmid pRiA4b ORF-3-like protein
MASIEGTVPAEIYQLKVTLLGVDPPIWRRLLVRADATLEQLHNVLQSAMGWEDEHMHEFSIGQRPAGRRSRDGAPSVENERTVRLFDILKRVGSKATYMYDFGDDWEHGIVLEKRLPVDPNVTYPVCTDGQLACPPEDCGGIYGYYDLVEALSDPNHARHEEMLDWIGEFDPQAFSVEKVNRALTPLPRRKARK